MVLALGSVTDGTRLLSAHPTKPIVAYEAETFVVLWDCSADKKYILSGHTAPIGALSFTRDGLMVLSVEVGYQPKLILWRWRQLTAVSHAIAPTKNRRKPIKHISVDFSHDNELLVCVEGDINGRASLWSWQKGLVLLNTVSLENEAPVNSVLFLSDHTHFATIESTCVKFWAVDVDRTSLVSRVHVRRDISSGKLNPLSGLVFVLSQTGKVLVLNSQGQYVSSIHREGVTFTALLFFEDKLFLGTATGSVQVYHSSTFAFQQEIPYSGLGSVRINKSTVRQTTTQAGGGLKVVQGPAVTCLDVSCEGVYLVVCHADRSFFVLSMEDNREVLCSAIGHSGRIQACEIGSKRSDWFISSASDSLVRLWTRSGDRWISKPLDILQLNAGGVRSQSDLAHSTSHFATSPSSKPRDSKTVSVTALAVHPRESVVVCGTSTGQLKLFDVSADAVRSSLKLSESACIALTFHMSGRYVGCAQANGVVSLIDSSQGLRQIGILEDNVNYAFHQAAESHKGVRFVKDVGNSILAASVNNFKDVMGTISSTTTDLGVITVTNPRMLRLQRIYNGSTGLHKNTLVQYPLEAECVGFAIHPSDQYLLVTCRTGSIHLFHIETGELRGLIQVPESSFGCCVDPSGLYVIVCSPSDSQSSITSSAQSSKGSLIKQTALYTHTDTDTDTNDTNDMKLGHRLCFFEVGTGKFAGSFDRLPPLSTFSFAADLSFFQASSYEGNVFIFTLADELRQNAEDALEVSRKQPDFWNAYPIHLNVESQQKARTMSSPVRKPIHSMSTDGLSGNGFSKAVQSATRTRKSQPMSPLKVYDESSPEPIHRRSAPQLTRFSLDQPLRFEDYIDNETYGVENRPIKSRNSKPVRAQQSTGGQRRGQSSGQRAFSRVVATDADRLDDDLDLYQNGAAYEDEDEDENDRYGHGRLSYAAANGIVDDDDDDGNCDVYADTIAGRSSAHTQPMTAQQVLAKFTRGKPAANAKGVSTNQMRQSHSMLPERDVPSKLQSRPANRLTADLDSEPNHSKDHTAEGYDDDSVYENERFKLEFLGVVEEARRSVTPVAGAKSSLRGTAAAGVGVVGLQTRRSNDGGRSLKQKLAAVKIGSGKQIAPEPDDIDDEVDDHLHEPHLQPKPKSSPTRVAKNTKIASGYVNNDLIAEPNHQGRNLGGRWQHVLSQQRSQRQSNSMMEDDNFNDNGPFEEPLTDRSHLVSEPDSIDNDYRSSAPQSIQRRSGQTSQPLQKGSRTGSHEHLLSREDLLALNVNRSLVRSGADGLLDRSTFETVEAKRLRDSRNGFAMDDDDLIDADVELTSKQRGTHSNGVQHRQYGSPNNRRPVGGVKDSDQIVFARRGIEKDTESVIEEVDSVFEELATFDSRLKTIQEQEAAKREQVAKMLQNAAKLTTGTKVAPSGLSKIFAK